MNVTRKKRLVAALAGGLVALGVAAPAVAENSRPSYMTAWRDGDGSSNWFDSNSDSANTHVTFYDCTREFKATIRKTVNNLPDPSRGSEWINCTSYADAVYGGDLDRGNYHFDVNGMGTAYCVPGGSSCIYNKTTVKNLRIYW